MPKVEPVPTNAMREAQAQIRQNREELVHAGLALRAQLNEMTDWRAWYRKAPVVWIGGALLAGYLLGQLPPRPSSR